MNKRALPAGRQAFTLIELLLAAAILIAVFACCNYLIGAAVRQGRTAAGLARAVNLARQEMERLRSVPATAELEVFSVSVKWSNDKPPVQLFSLKGAVR